MATIREDKYGMWVAAGGYISRPVSTSQWKVGDTVKARQQEKSTRVIVKGNSDQAPEEWMNTGITTADYKAKKVTEEELEASCQFLKTKKIKYYAILMTTEIYPLLHNCRVWSSRHTGQENIDRIEFATYTDLESCVREVFEDYCKFTNLTETYPRCDWQTRQIQQDNILTTYNYRYAENGVLIEGREKGSWRTGGFIEWTLTRQIEMQVTEEIRTRKELEVDGEIYVCETVERKHSEWSPYPYPDQFTIISEARTKYFIGKSEEEK